MKVSARTIEAIGQIVTGDANLSPYRSGPQLVRLFNDYGFNDVYGQGFPSRWQYAEDRLRGLNDTPAFASLLCQVLDPREYMDTDHDVGEAAEFINKRLRYDGFEMIVKGGKAAVRDLEGASVECEHPFKGSTEDGHLFIDEQLTKAKVKIQEGDFDGAITNARSLLEAVLIELERELSEEPPQYDGDLGRLYRRVQKLMNLHPGRPDLDNALRQVLSGLSSIVSGLSGLSNRLGDRHVRRYRPSKRHAVLVVNAANTLANFLFETHLHHSSGHVAPSGSTARRPPAGQG